MCSCKQTGRMFQSLVWKRVLSNCFTQAPSAWLSWCISQLLAPRLLSTAQMLPRKREGKRESFRQTIHNRLGSDLRLTDANWNNSSGFNIQNYLALEQGCWDLTLAERVQSLGALRIQKLRLRRPCAAMDCRIPLSQMPEKVFFRSTLLCHPNGNIQAEW